MWTKGYAMLNAIKIDDTPPRLPSGSTYGEDELRAMQRAMVNIFDRWRVSDVDASTVLGGISAKTFRRWKDGEFGRVNRDLADRMSNLLGIHKALRIIFSDPQTGYAWVTTANDALAGRSPLEIMKGGGMEDVVRIRRYLDSVRGGW
jgi:hypothetical protein